MNFQSLPGKKYPKVQLLTITDLLAGKKLEYPDLGPKSAATFKKFPRKRKGSSPKETQGQLLE